MTSIKKIPCSGLEKFIGTAQLSDKPPYDPYIPWLDKDSKTFRNAGPRAALSLKLLHSFPEGHPLSCCAVYAGPDIFCMYTGDLLTGICTVFTYEEKEQLLHELYCLVHPDYRRHGIGAALICRAAEYLLKDGGKKNRRSHGKPPVPFRPRIYLVGSDTLFAGRLGCTFSHSEHFMYYTGEDAPVSDRPPDLPPEQGLRFADTELPGGAREFFLKKNSGILCRCQVDETPEFINISHVFTEEPFRNRGYASMLIKHITGRYPGRKLLLQVSGQNHPAIRAYQKAGFTFLQTTEYYLYPD